MKEFVDLENYVRSMPQNKLLNREQMLAKIEIKKAEFMQREHIDNKWFNRANIDPQKGDLVSSPILGLEHPAIVIKVEGEVVYAVTLTTAPGSPSLLSKVMGSRLLPTSYFTSTVVSMSKEKARQTFFGVFDAPKELEKTIKVLSLQYKNIFSNAKSKTKKKVAASQEEQSRHIEDASSIFQENAGI